MKTTFIIACGLFSILPVRSEAAPETNTPEAQSSATPAAPALAPLGERLAEGSAPGFGATRPRLEGTLSLADAVRFAQRESPILRGAEAELKMAEAQVASARAGKRPSVSATTFVTSGSESGAIYNTPATVMPQNLLAVPRGPFANQNVMLMWPLLTGGRLPALLRQAQAARAASSAERDVVALDLALEVKTAYWQVLLARAMEAVATERQKATTERLNNDRAAAEAGRIPQLYVLRDQAEDADAAQEVTNAARDVEIALIMLRTVLGAASDSDFTLSDSLENLPATREAAFVEEALSNRPELRAAQSRLEGARHGLRAAQAASRPQVAFSAMADAGRMRGSGWGGGASVGLVLGVPLLDGGMRRAERASAAAGAAKVQADYDGLKLQIEREVLTSQVSLAAARKNVATAQAAITAATEEYRVAALRYESGRGTNVEVLDALAALTRARGNLARALFEVQTASARLERARGTGL